MNPGRPDSLLQVYPTINQNRLYIIIYSSDWIAYSKDKIEDGRNDDSEQEDYGQACLDDEDSDVVSHGHGGSSSSVVGGHTPCQSGGLHMPDQTRFSDFVQRVKRLRYFSQCLPMASANQGSPGSGSSIGTVVDSTSSFGQAMGSTSASHSRSRKRSNSCPNLLQLESGERQMVTEGAKEEPSSSGSVTSQQQNSVACQTDQDLWPPTPYEHLFFSVLPPSLLFPPPAPAEASPKQLAPSDLLDRYIDAAFRNHERSVALSGKPNANEDVALLKGNSTCFLFLAAAQLVLALAPLPTMTNLMTHCQKCCFDKTKRVLSTE